MARGRRRGGVSRLGIIIIVGVILLLVLTVISIIGVIFTSKTSASTVPATLNSTNISWDSSEKAAIDNAILVAFDDQVLTFAESDSVGKISITLYGKNSGKTYSASTGNFGIANVLGISVISVDGLNFSFDANEFEVDEIVVIKAQFDSDESTLDKAFQDGTSYGYFAFKVGESQKPAESGNQAPDVDTSTAPAPSTTTPAGTATQSSNVYFNGFMVASYPSREEALTSPISIGEDAVNCSIKCSVGDNVKRVRVWTENNQGTSHGDEFFLWSDNGWTANVDFSAWSGETILICVCISDNSVPATNTYSYIAANIP